MKIWPQHPVLYEINTWVWLGELSRQHGRPLTLATVPPEEWGRIAASGFDAVWFMGVWERTISSNWAGTEPFRPPPFERCHRDVRPCLNSKDRGSNLVIISYA